MASLNAVSRFSAAHSEINARISSRANLNIGHLAGVTSVTALYYTAMFAAAEHPNLGIQNYYPLIAIAIPLISTYFVSLYVHNDIIIGLLGAFCAAIEAAEENEAQDCRLPRWFGGGAAEDQDVWLYEALAARKWADWSVIGLCAVSPCVVFVDVIEQFAARGFDSFLPITEEGALHGVAFCTCVVISVWNIARLVGVYKERDAIKRHVRYDPMTRRVSLTPQSRRRKEQ